MKSENKVSVKIFRKIGFISLIIIIALTIGVLATKKEVNYVTISFPEGYEAGTINAPAIIGLGASAKYIEKIGISVINEYEKELIGYLDENLLNIFDIQLSYHIQELLFCRRFHVFHHAKQSPHFTSNSNIRILIFQLFKGSVYQTVKNTV